MKTPFQIVLAAWCSIFAGSCLRYSFDIVSGKKARQEVGVDAKTGRLLENGVEGPNAAVSISPETRHGN